MSSMTDLLTRLKKSGVPVTNKIKIAMEFIKPDIFTDHDLELFWNDMPTPFFMTENGSVKSISAPHMIVTLLYHLEILENQNILIMGSKSGYLGALVDRIIGKDGNVMILEPHNQVRDYTSKRISKHNTIGTIEICSQKDLLESEKKFDRILITGYLRNVSEDIQFHVKDGGFVLAPIGSSIHQRLLKKEKQGNVWMDTDLGGVIFGPMDLTEINNNPLDSKNIIEHMEVALELILEVIEIEEESLVRIRDLISSIRELPDDIPPLDQYSSDDEIFEHPIMELLLSEQEWLGPLWPILTGLDNIFISDFNEMHGDEYSNNGGHSDLVP
ncbi:protein-L-isoaspartate O-methyltransferase [Euryarchaeota archaeon]|nr:protein-L-isoaspartate O-methyltransferase [Euryarchaeota archaeon]